MNVAKKVWTVALLILLLISVLSACADNPSPDSDEPSDPKGNESFSVVCNGISVTLGESASSVVNRLGTPLADPLEVFDCGAGNSRMYYRYASLELYTVKSSDGTETIDQIELKDDLCQTAKGVGIGSEESEVRTAYGAPNQEKNGMLTYISGNQRLIFTVTDGTVTEIGLLCVTQ